MKVFISSRESICDECGEELGRHAWMTLVEGKGALCLSCADMDYLIFLPSGDAALTRWTGKYSILSVVVLKWSRARKRYERQGLLVEVYSETGYTTLLAELQDIEPDFEHISRQYQQLKNRDYFHSDLGMQVREALIARRGEST